MSFYKFAKGLVRCFCYIAFRIKVEGLENIPKDKAFVVCANHKSNLDPPILGVTLPVNLRYMAKEELFENKLFAKIITALGAFPIKRGKSDVGALRASIKMLTDGEPLAIFPEGGRSPKGGYMRKGKQGAALVAIKAGVNILPVGICGEYKPFSRIIVRVGKIIELEEYSGKKNGSQELQDITDSIIMPTIAELAEVKTYESRNS